MAARLALAVLAKERDPVRSSSPAERVSGTPLGLPGTTELTSRTRVEASAWSLLTLGSRSAIWVTVDTGRKVPRLL